MMRSCGEPREGKEVGMAGDALLAVSGLLEVNGLDGFVLCF